MARTVTSLVFPGDIESHEQFISFRLADRYKFKRQQIDKKDVYATIKLPLPSNLSTTYAATYSNEGLGMIGNMAATNAEAVLGQMNKAAGLADNFSFQGAVDSLKGIVTSAMGGQDLKQIAGNLVRYYGPELAKEAGALIGGAVGGAGLGKIGTVAGAAIGAGVGEAVKGAQVGLGIARNPYLAAAFEGVGFKTHNFQFQLTPRNSKESEILAQIISAFRNAMLPGGKAISQYYDYPKQVDIEFNDPTYLFDIKTSVCTQFDINYHGKGAYYHDVDGDKAPVEVTLNTTFLESTVRLANDETGPSTRFQIVSPKDSRGQKPKAVPKTKSKPVTRPGTTTSSSNPNAARFSSGNDFGNVGSQNPARTGPF